MITNKVLCWTLCCFLDNAYNDILDMLEIKAVQNEGFEIKADDLMEKMLDGVYKGYLKKYRNIGRNATYYSKISQITTTILVAKNKIIQTEVVHDNVSFKEFNIRRRNRTLKSLLEYHIDPSPDFKNLEDEITILTRKFNQLSSTPNPKSARREFYFGNDDEDLIPKEKRKTQHLMQQFIYETQYMLPYTQIVRKKYMTNVRYQMGYCFALIRNLKKQQMMIYSTMKKYYDLILTVSGLIELYQRILRLDVDIKDLLKLMYSLDAKRKDLEKDKKTTQFYPYY